ncbi:MAG: right-handed parallel beta-helix repeat-containing protein, partial [Gammaproteobacteria bacterium]
MSKRWLLAVSALVLLSAGCGGGGSEPPAGGNPPSTIPSAPPAANPGSGFPAAFDVGATYTRELYVDAAAAPGGDGSAARPYTTIGAAIAQATAGTRIRIAAGTYGAIGTYSNLRGTASAPIALVGTGAVVIDTGRSAQALHLIDPRYVVIDGITVQNIAPHGINIDDGGDYSTPAEYVVLRNVTFRDIGTGGNNDCLKLSGVDRFYIEGSSFSGCNRGEAIDMVGCHDGVISGNRFFNLPVNGVQTKGGSADVLIHGNRFSDIAQRSINAGGSTGATFYRPSNTTHEAARIQMIANIFERTGSAPVAFVGCDTCVFANNTIVEPGTYLARILEENTTLGPGANGYFINNIVLLNTIGRGAVVNVDANTQPATYTFGSNLWYSLDDPGYTGPTLGGGVPAETGSLIQQNPQLD